MVKAMSPRAKRGATSESSSTATAVPEADPAKELLWARPGFLVRRLHQIHVAMFFEECKAPNITPVQYAILTVLSVLPGLDQTSLGQEVGLDRTTTMDVVRRLEDRGLVERRENPADRRTRHVHLTREGKSVVTSLRADMARAQERMLAPLKPAQREVFMELLATLVEANNQYSRTVLRSM
ncbi:putative transcription regulator, MarR family [Cupriavidus taiwanensis]|nr:MarR family transcriptional regulator [Cupriavidus alkaliphilus]SCB23857.1 transcriptional regulator, MarR family [Cupriavidus alkaliphilus]SOZ19824.1 putative transcription regulator, MarR family [Cupriavidus taiwanensis]SOZ33080.1 putative transcription regulator, MarR family [Cupriavidus taiwanensis]SOZ48399.1 putative transcription regulator, MarR family [Cupriavidus taiwanensis]